MDIRQATYYKRIFLRFHEYHVAWSTLTDLSIVVLDHHPTTVMNGGGGDVEYLFSKPILTP